MKTLIIGTPAVAAAIPKVVAAVLAELSNQQPTFPSKLLPANCYLLPKEEL